jgi:hypothetical protein
MRELAAAIITLTLIIFALWAMQRFEDRRLRALAASRRPWSYSEFQSHFHSVAITDAELRTIVRFIQEWLSETKHFPVESSDEIGAVYGIIDDDLDEMVIKVVRKCGRKLPGQAALDTMEPIRTVGDLVRFVASCPMRATTNSVAQSGPASNG